jgi:hypothetical protein
MVVAQDLRVSFPKDSNEIASFQIQEDDLVILGSAGNGLNFVSLSTNVSSIESAWPRCRS